MKMPEFVEVDGDQPSVQTPSLHTLEDDVINLSDYLDDPTDPVKCVPEQDHDHSWRLLNSGSQIQLNHEEASWEYHSGQVFPTLELVQVVERHHGTNLQLRALGSQFNWTLNQEVVFSAALTGKPKKKLYFSQYCWKRRASGAKYDYATALSRPAWQHALSHGDLPSLQQEDCKDPLIFSP